VAFRGEDWDRRAWVIGTAHDVWQIVRAWQDFGDVEVMLDASDLTERQIRLALAYHQRFPDEIDAAIREDRRSLASLRSEYPFIDTAHG
jgi:uncharacterized protein (DUF433 family)